MEFHSHSCLVSKFSNSLLHRKDGSESDDDDDSDDSSNWDSNSSSSSSSDDSDDDGLPTAGAQLKGRAFWLKKAAVVKTKVEKDKVGRSEERKRLKEEAARVRAQQDQEGRASGGERDGLGLLPAEATLTPSLIQKKSLEILSSRGRKVSLTPRISSCSRIPVHSSLPGRSTFFPLSRVPTPRRCWRSWRH